jgi:hypothetical protein
VGFVKIEHQIKHYRIRISNAEKELLKLIEKSNTKDLNAKEEAAFYLKSLLPTLIH